MNKDDFVIQSEVRRMLIRTNIDYTKIEFGTVRGVVYLRGMFRPIQPLVGNEEIMRSFFVKILLSFEKKIRNIPGVSDVVFQFTNWRKEKGRWIPLQSMKTEEKIEKKVEGKPEAEKGENGEGEDEGEDEGETAPVI